VCFCFSSETDNFIFLKKYFSEKKYFLQKKKKVKILWRFDLFLVFMKIVPQSVSLIGLPFSS